LPDIEDIQSYVVPEYQSRAKTPAIPGLVRVSFIVTNLSYPLKEIVHFYNSRGTAE
jgi:hypothetical protein